MTHIPAVDEEVLLAFLGSILRLDNKTVNGQFTINNEQLIINSVQVYDVYGKLLKAVEVNSNTAVIDAHELSAGMYFVRVSTEKGVVTKSFVKK